MTDDCDPEPTRLYQSFSSGDLFPLGDTSMSTIYVDNSNLNSRCDFTVHVYEEVELPPSILINELLCADVTSIYFVIEDERADNVNVPFQHYAMNDCDPEPRRMLVLISSLLEVQQLM